MRHGAPSGVDAATFLGDDPALAMVNADMDAWLKAHPCNCETVCKCDLPAADAGMPGGP